MLMHVLPIGSRRWIDCDNSSLPPQRAPPPRYATPDRPATTGNGQAPIFDKLGICRGTRTEMTEKKSQLPHRNAVLEQLSDKFEVIGKCLPLALGIHKEILARVPEIEPTQLRSAMRIHTASTRYLKELLTTQARFDLDGNPVGEVTEEQRELASATLKERFRKNAERRQLDRQAQIDAQREHEALQKRQEKLAQLAARFNNR